MAPDTKAIPEANVRFEKALLHPRHFGSWFLLFVALLLSLLPHKARHGLGRLLGFYLYHHNPKRRHVVQANLRQVFPDSTNQVLQLKVREHLNWYGKALVDYSLFFFGSKRRLQSLTTIINEQFLSELKASKQPIILMLAHSVMLEFAVVALSKDYRSFGSYKASSNPVLDWMIARSRCHFADFVVSRDAGLRPLLRAIKSQRIMIFLPDEDLGMNNAVFADFFGRQKATLTTPARLTKLGGAKAVAGFVAFDTTTQKYQLHLQPMPATYPVGSAEPDASALNKALSSLIWQDPVQYLWMMKCFRSTAEGDEKLY